MKKKIISGIYCIENLRNHKKYVGQAINVNNRIMRHKSLLRNNHENSVVLQRAWNKYGEINFIFYIIEECPIEKLNEKEEYYIKILCSHISEWGYNISMGGNSSMRGRKHTVEELEKMRIGNLGKIVSESTRKLMSENHANFSGKNHPMWGKKMSLESKKLMSENRPNVRGKNNPMWGNNHSDESKIKIGDGHRGKKLPNSSSPYFGIYKTVVNRDYGKKIYVYWRTSIWNGKNLVHVGSYKTEIESAKAYDKYIIENNLLRPLNFPEDYLN